MGARHGGKPWDGMNGIAANLLLNPRRHVFDGSLNVDINEITYQPCSLPSFIFYFRRCRPWLCLPIGGEIYRRPEPWIRSLRKFSAATDNSRVWTPGYQHTWLVLLLLREGVNISTQTATWKGSDGV